MTLPLFDIMNSTIFQGDALNILKALPSDYFRCAITSPPYWGLRDYDIEGQIGLEPELQQYVDRLAGIFCEVKRVLKNDGSLWLNIGDGYTSGDRGWRAPDKKNRARAMQTRPDTPQGLKPKDLLGIPWRLAFALQARGWYLRSEVIWHKPNAQPESVKDRPTRAHEHLFLLTKAERYYYDYEAVMEVNGNGRRNRRSVWSIQTKAFPGTNFATFPPTLIEPCVLASSRPGDYVLDPFFGTGTVGVVCVQHGRSFVGIELHPQYVRLAAERLTMSEERIIRGAGDHE